MQLLYGSEDRLHRRLVAVMSFMLSAMDAVVVVVIVIIVVVFVLHRRRRRHGGGRRRSSTPLPSTRFVTPDPAWFVSAGFYSLRCCEPDSVWT